MKPRLSLPAMLLRNPLSGLDDVVDGAVVATQRLGAVCVHHLQELLYKVINHAVA